MAHRLTRPLTTTRLAFPLLLGLTLSVSGCTDTCDGPTCESTWPTARLVGHVPNRWPADPNPTADATSSIQGVASQGVGWRLSSHNDRTLLAQPDAQRVVAIDSPFGDETLADIAQGLVLASDDAGFGTAVAQSDAWVVVGAPHAMLSAGTVSIYRDLPQTGIVEQDQALRLLGSTAGDQTGAQVQMCADSDGDGLPELLIGAPSLTDTAALQGGAWWVASASLTNLDNGSVSLADVGILRTGIAGGSRLGSSLLCTLDVDQDGLDDVILGAPTGAANDGFVEWVSGQDLRSGEFTASGISTGRTTDAWFGSQLAAVRTPTARLLAVSSSGANGGAGLVSLFDPVQLFTTEQAPASSTLSTLNTDTRHFGRQLLAADIDGDDVDELIIGASDATVDGDLAAGRLFIWSGQDWPNTLVDGADHLVEGTHAFQRVGQWTSLADTDNNGTVELYMSLRAADVQ